MCAVGATCETEVHEQTTVVHAPVEVPPPARTAAPLPSATAVETESGPFWEPDPTGQHAVAILRNDAPNMHYAAMDQATCEGELRKRNVAFIAAGATPGVLAPLRLRGALSGGVTIHSLLPATARDTAAMEIFDCRLVLALDDFSGALAKRGVTEMIHLSAYRSRANNGCTPKYDGKQHCGALAVDIAEFRRRDGSSLNVQHDFHGKIGQPTCPARPNELWSIVCDAADKATFNVMLTPNYNAQHFNHVHVEITPDAEWMLVH
jgi:hypothetical protein